MTGFGLYHSYVIMNVTNLNQSLVKSEICHYFIRLTIYKAANTLKENVVNVVSKGASNTWLQISQPVVK